MFYQFALLLKRGVENSQGGYITKCQALFSATIRECFELLLSNF